VDYGVFIPIAGLAMVTAVTISLVGLASKWLDVRRGRPPKELTAIEERLSRIEQAVDAIAVETERVSEGQRFVTRLLAERATAAARDDAPRGSS
jgi:hypothetical protein